MLKRNDGMTLLETLAVVVIVAIVGLLTWNIFFQGLNYSNKAITKNQMQQQANVIITELTKIHQTSDSYIIKTPTNPCEIEIEETSLSRSYKYANSQLCYKLEISNDHLDTSINPKGNKNHKKLKLKLIIYDKKDNENNLEVGFILHRL